MLKIALELSPVRRRVGRRRHQVLRSTPRGRRSRCASGRVHGRARASIEYEPGESQTGLFGGNSNWRGPVWFPVNVLLTDKLRALGRHYGDSSTIELPTGSGNWRTLVEAADLIDNSLTAIFCPVDGRRPADGKRIEAGDSPLWKAHPTFSEYFDGDAGEGLGASHQTGWTALVAHLLNPRLPPDPRWV